MSSGRITKYEMDTLKFNAGMRQQNIATTRQPRIDTKQQREVGEDDDEYQEVSRLFLFTMTGIFSLILVLTL